MQNSLHHPQDPDPRDGDHFSAPVAEALGEAYSSIRLHHGAPKGQRDARQLVSTLDAMPMSPRQRMQVCYVRATAALSHGDYPECMSLLTEAEALAVSLPDPLAGAELSYLHAAAEIMRHGYDHARSHYARSIELLIAARGDDLSRPSPDPEIEATAILGVAGCDFLAGRYREAQRYVELAQSLVAEAPKPLTAATLAWLQASLDRWRGDAAQALRTALAAAESFAQSSSLGCVGQLLHLAALCALDLAEPSEGAQPGEITLVAASWLAMAEPLVARTLRHTWATADEALEGHALLAEARLRRLSRPRAVSSAGETVAEAMIVRAEGLRDPVLLCEALTELGHQRAARGQLEAAKATYHEAMAEAQANGVKALGVWPQRALERLERRPRSTDGH